jgi:capsular polysaccharide biosynthesis protein
METLDAEPRGWDEEPGLLQSAWRYNWIVAVAALLGALLGYGLAARQPVLYQGTSRLLFGSTSATLPGQAGQPSGDPDRYLNNQAQLIRSSEVLERAAERSEVKGVTADSLAAALTVEVQKDADVITISVLDRTPQGAAKLANAVGAAYQDYVAGQPRKAAEELRSLNSRLQDRVREINNALAATPPPSDAAILRLERDAIRKQQQANADQIAAIANAGDGNPVRLQEKSAVPGRPAQPATRRTVAIGVLLGLLGGVALAWTLNTRRMAGASVKWPAPSSALRDRGAGGDLTPELYGATARSVEADTAGHEPAGVPTGNGVKLGGAVALLVRRLVRERSLDLDQVQSSSVPPADEAEAGGEGLIELLTRLEAALADEPLHHYAEFLPQVMAEELTNDAFADLVAILLDNGAGSFEVVGAVGLTAEEQHATVDQGHHLLQQACQDGLIVVQDTRLLGTAAADIPGSQTSEAFILVPLAPGPSCIGVLFVGRRSGNGRRAIAFDEQEMGDLIGYVTDCVPLLNSLLLLRRLQQSLAVLHPSHS